MPDGRLEATDPAGPTSLTGRTDPAGFVRQRREIDWLVRETGQRWLLASRRWVPSIVPPGSAPRISAAGDRPAADGSAAARLILWEVGREFPETLLAWVASHRPWPRSTALVAVGLPQIPPRYLTEFGVVALIGQPEHLTRLRPLVGAVLAAGPSRHGFATLSAAGLLP